MWKVSTRSILEKMKLDMQQPKEQNCNSYITFTVQMKNWLPLVLGPAFAMLKTPGPTCFTANDGFRILAQY